jgi:hypothetical protein
VNSLRPSARQFASVLSGTRKQVPELISVVPPTPLPMGMGMTWLPTDAVSPAFRYILRIVAIGRPSKSLRVKC